MRSPLLAGILFCGASTASAAPAFTYHGLVDCPGAERRVAVEMTVGAWLNKAKGTLNVEWRRGSKVSKVWKADFHVTKTPGVNDSKIVIDRQSSDLSPQGLEVVIEANAPSSLKGVCTFGAVRLLKGEKAPDKPDYPISSGDGYAFTDVPDLRRRANGDPCTADGKPRRPFDDELSAATEYYVWTRICGPSDANSADFNGRALAASVLGVTSFSINGSQCIIHIGDGERDISTTFLYLQGNYDCSDNGADAKCSGTVGMGIGAGGNAAAATVMFDAISAAGAMTNAPISSELSWDDDQCLWRGKSAVLNGKQL
ncbi:hypothetical protein [Rhizobium sp. S163]|uniref:hypothetical protein n=1 Tax=Rhizobium sp. S163 TaxID=3055039 RepID=UPI0025A95D14|nr:hypothetical protein [Rhizobium sp. S163]MDM9649104.1 hypothetical protein [Rhizobium sp. S163]